MSTQCSCLVKHNPSMSGDSLFSYSYLRDMRWWWGKDTWGITSVYLCSPVSCTTCACYYKSSLWIINHHREEPFQQGLFSYVRSVLVLWIYQSLVLMGLGGSRNGSIRDLPFLIVCLFGSSWSSWLTGVLMRLWKRSNQLKRGTRIESLDGLGSSLPAFDWLPPQALKLARILSALDSYHPLIHNQPARINWCRRSGISSIKGSCRQRSHLTSKQRVSLRLNKGRNISPSHSSSHQVYPL